MVGINNSASPSVLSVWGYHRFLQFYTIQVPPQNIRNSALNETKHHICRTTGQWHYRRAWFRVPNWFMRLKVQTARGMSNSPYTQSHSLTLKKSEDNGFIKLDKYNSEKYWMSTVKSRSPKMWVLICRSVKSKVSQNPVCIQCMTIEIVTQT